MWASKALHWLRLSALFPALLVLLSGCTTPSIERNKLHLEGMQKNRFGRNIDGILIGQWEGSLTRRNPVSATSKYSPPDPSDLSFRLVIDDQSVRIYIKESDDWIEAMPGKFRAIATVTNATIIGTHTSATPGWIENWAMLVTAEDNDTLIAEWSRVVNNLDPGPRGLPAFSMAAVGKLRRTSFQADK